MLKKAGIIVAASAASMLVATPFAFAGDYAGDSTNGGPGKSDSHDKGGKDHGKGDKGGKHHGSHDSSTIDKEAKGLLAGGLSGNNVNVPIQVCNNNIPVNALGVQVPLEDLGLLNGLTGALGIAGKAEAKSGDSVTSQPDNCGQQSGAGDSIR